jgi:hypothetical protein
LDRGLADKLFDLIYKDKLIRVSAR